MEGVREDDSVTDKLQGGRAQRILLDLKSALSFRGM